MLPKKFTYSKAYTLSNCTYYALNALVINFSTLFLQSFGLSATIIGVTFAISSCLCIGLETYLSYKIDNGKGFTNIRVLLACYILLAILAFFVFLFLENIKLILCIFAIIIAFVISMQQYTNALGMEINNTGKELHYGFSRGSGSVAYIVVTLIVGTILQKQGSSVFPVLIMAVSIASVPIFWRFPKIDGGLTNKDEKQGSYLSIFRENPRLIFVFAGVTLVSIFTSCISYYMLMIVQNLGGNAQVLAYVNSFGTLCEIPFFFLYKKISKRFSAREMLLFSAIIYMIRCLMFTLVKSYVVLFLAQTLQGLSYSLFLTSSIMLVNEMTSNQNKAKGQALLNMTIMCIGNIVSSVVGGAIIDSFGIGAAMLFNCGCMFIGLICISVATLPDIIRSKRKMEGFAK